MLSPSSPPKTTGRIFAYLRVSTGEQAESGAGLKAQEDACQRWATRGGAGLAGEYRDEGVSGTAPLEARQGLLAALGKLKAGDVLLVAKRDRLARDPIVLAMIEAAVARRKARIVSAAGEGTEGDGPSDVLMRRIVDAFAEYERLVIRARTKAALVAKKARRERTGSSSPFPKSSKPSSSLASSTHRSAPCVSSPKLSLPGASSPGMALLFFLPRLHACLLVNW
jgi:DNA invertase Pin-like site-specific DNA recombinase